MIVQSKRTKFHFYSFLIQKYDKEMLEIRKKSCDCIYFLNIQSK